MTLTREQASHALAQIGIKPEQRERMLDTLDTLVRYRAHREAAGWADLAVMQAVTCEGDMGQLSSCYTWESAWALANPAPDDLARETQ